MSNHTPKIFTKLNFLGVRFTAVLDFADDERISDIAYFTHPKIRIIGWISFNNYLISCENYLSSHKCATTPQLSKVCNANGKVKNSTKL